MNSNGAPGTSSNLSTLFDFPLQIRKNIYTINIIENVNRIIRKYTRNKAVLLVTSGRKSCVSVPDSGKEKGAFLEGTGPIMLLQFINIFGELKT